jgi:hypothetical protein
VEEVTVRKGRVLIGVMVLASSVAACGIPITFVRGSGKVISESRNVTGFKAVSLSGTGQLTIDETGIESLTIMAEDNILPHLTSEVRGNRLMLGTRRNTNIRATREIVYKLTVKELTEIEVSGSGSVDARVKDLSRIEVSGSGRVDAQKIDIDRLRTTISGSGNVTVSGKADRQDITISGSGGYQGEDLESEEAKIVSSGSGDAVVNVKGYLEARLSGSGSVEYIGQPSSLAGRIRGSGTLRGR